MTSFPSIPKDLVLYLDELYSPARMLPRAGDSEREIWIKVGKRELVDMLLQARKDQETGADEGFPHVLVQPALGGAPDDPGAGYHTAPGATAARTAATPSDRHGYFPGRRP